jgi:hypothetical protein
LSPEDLNSLSPIHQVLFSSDDDASVANGEDDVGVTPTTTVQLPPLKAKNLDENVLAIGIHQYKSQYCQLKAAMIRISMLSEALKFAELYVISKARFGAVVDLGSSSKAKQISD